jgi:hypothetical protein
MARVLLAGPPVVGSAAMAMTGIVVMSWLSNHLPLRPSPKNTPR